MDRFRNRITHRNRNGRDHRWPHLAGARRIEPLFKINKDCTNAMYNIKNEVSAPAHANSDHFPLFHLRFMAARHRNRSSFPTHRP